jgi:hypothetical protein
MCLDTPCEINGALFPTIDRSAVSVGTLLEESDEKAYWQERTIAERLDAIERYRIIAYGYDACTARLQRVFDTAEFPSR